VTQQIRPEVKQHPPEDLTIHNPLEGNKQHPPGVWWSNKFLQRENVRRTPSRGQNTAKSSRVKSNQHPPWVL